jgi:glycosyltransferase involved in cell wall biosynthesis
MTRVDVVIPVLNEEAQLAASVATLRAHLAGCPFEARVIVADNGSTDATPEIARRLAAAHRDVSHLRLEERGRGRALRRAWLASDADIVSYMDVDLSTDLAAFAPMIVAIAGGGYELAIGSRLAKGAQVTRQWRREVLSRGYNLMIAATFPGRGFSDAQCGFKAITRRLAGELLPLVEDEAWFFDTELLLRAEAAGHRVFEVPVRWIEDPGSTVKIAKTVWEDVKGLARLRRELSSPRPRPPRRGTG